MFYVYILKENALYKNQYFINISKIFMKYFSFFLNYFNIICHTYIFQFSKIVCRMKKIMEIK